LVKNSSSIILTTIKASYQTYRHLLVLTALLAFCLPGMSLFGQSVTSVSGVVLDQSNLQPIPFVNVYFSNSSEGTTTDNDGRFTLMATFPYDSLVVSFVGFHKKILAIAVGQSQNLTIMLHPETINLDEVTIMSGENPAWEIIRKVVNNKSLHDKRSLAAYQYRNYSRLEFDIENISTRLTQRKMVRDIWAGIDSTSLEKNDQGNAVLPVFLSETVSLYFVKNAPFARREEIEKSKVSGVAVEDGSMVSQVIGAAYQDYNFYQNWMRFLEKEFISPIADTWRMFYDYEITDTLMVGEDLCYQLSIYPNRMEDPAFNGTMWITTNEFALKKIDAYIDKATNLNFMEKIELAQELGKTSAGQWLPTTTELKIDVSNLGKNSASIWVQSLNTTSDWRVNDVKDKRFYTNEVQVAEDFAIFDESYWQQERPMTLSPLQLRAYDVIDTLVEIPRVRSIVEFVKLATTGYWRRGKFDLGPYLYSYAYNTFEGNAFRLGFKTNEHLSRKIAIKSYVGYGTADEQWKYGFTGRYIVNRKPWTEFQMHSSRDLEQVGINSEDLIEDNYIFYAATRWQTFRRPYYISKNKFSLQSEPTKGLTQKLSIRHDYYDPQYPFYYFENPGNPTGSELKSDLSSSSVQLTTRWARDEMYLQDGNDRVSLGSRRALVIQFDYTYGFKHVLDSDFEYHKLELGIFQKIRVGGLGDSRLKLKGGYVFGQVPYLLLENHIGNESPFYTTGAFNTMNYFEFVSDQYASLHYQHYFQGLLMNKIPLIRKLKWRLLGTANILYGSLRQENIDIMSDQDPDGNPTFGFQGMDKGKPFVELGYGIENIFKFIRVDGIHRITYRDQPDAQKFALKVSFQFKL
jgi:hypothetical protein